MPVCVHCARPTPALLATFGSGHVVLTRCGYDAKGSEGCARLADPYFEHGSTILFIDLILSKPRVYRHILYNRGRSGLDSHAQSGALPKFWAHVRHFLAFVLVESYLRWFSVHPYAVARDHVPILFPRDYRRPWAWLAALAPYLAPSLHSTMRVFFATLIEMVLLHTAVVGLSYVLCRLWAQRSTRHAQLYRWYMPSVALLFSNISTLLLLSFVLVWDSRLPADGRAQQAARMDLSQWIGVAHDAQQHPWLAPLAAAAREWNTEWLVRNLIGGMSAGVALGVVLPVHPLAGALVMLLGLLTQAATRHHIVHLPGSHSATFLMQHGPVESQRAIAAYCQA
ncbi:sterol homeostasis protein [Malassezia japonica]|uniref:Protein ARV n=1 Tax=Malassezia japonica TaxID=223818 RepID=A0AAF0F106_9BASI|nr:sterol homeostasis protein [Malassezia japonica]WFD38522.1 sterol homeostasis protein [Malassezia japonica]